MKEPGQIKSTVLAIVLSAGMLALPGLALGFGSERAAQSQINQQVLVERFDKIMRLAQIQHAKIEAWHKKARTHEKQNKTVQKTRNVVAMQQ